MPGVDSGGAPLNFEGVRGLTCVLVRLLFAGGMSQFVGVCLYIRASHIFCLIPPCSPRWKRVVCGLDAGLCRCHVILAQPGPLSFIHCVGLPTMPVLLMPGNPGQFSLVYLCQAVCTHVH